MEEHSDIDSSSSGLAARRSALFVATLSSFLTPFMGSSINVALPAIAEEFSMDAVSLAWVATSYLLSAAMFLVPLGSIADRYGRKRLFLSGIVIFTISSLLSALAPTGEVLIAVRIVQGIGGSMIFGTSIAILTSIYPIGERGRVLGITISAVYLGLSLGPVLGGVLTQRLGWRSVFFIHVPLGLAIIAAVLWKLRGEWYGRREGSLDIAGSILYCLALVQIMYGFTQLREMSGTLLVLGGLLTFILFIFQENRVSYPVLHLQLFRANPAFAYSNLAAFLNYGATFAVGFLTSLYLQYIKGFSPQQAGAVLIAQPLFMALLSPIAGRLSDRIEPRLVATSGMVLTTLSLVFLAFLGEETALFYLVMTLCLLGVGIALFSSPNTNAIMSSVDRRHYGLASAMTSTMRLTGQMFSMGLTMLLLSTIMGKVHVTVETHDRFLLTTRLAFIVFALLCGMGIFASLARGSMRNDGEVSRFH